MVSYRMTDCLRLVGAIGITSEEVGGRTDQSVDFGTPDLRICKGRG